MEKHKFIWPITIILASIILAGGFYFIESNKQASIERQQVQKLEAEKIKNDQDNAQKQKEYIAKRKNDCLDLYEKEHKNWNNVNGWWYREDTDTCVVQYIDQKWKEGTSEIGEWNDTLKEFVGGKYFTKDF